MISRGVRAFVFVVIAGGVVAGMICGYVIRAAINEIANYQVEK